MAVILAPCFRSFGFKTSPPGVFKNKKLIIFRI